MSVPGPEAILIAGPTASGKSALAITLAQRLSGTVVNADSMQVYRDLRVLSARPSKAEEAAAPHVLFGHVDGAVNYSVGLWLADAARTLADLRGQGRLPIFTGGTGMYFKGLLRGLSDIPPVPEEVRARAARGLDPALPVMRAHGVPGVVAYLRGEASLEAAIQKGKTDTRHYSKRQFTFIRHQLPEFAWAAPEAAEQAVFAMLGR